MKRSEVYTRGDAASYLREKRRAAGSVEQEAYQSVLMQLCEPVSDEELLKTMQEWFFLATKEMTRATSPEYKQALGAHSWIYCDAACLLRFLSSLIKSYLSIEREVSQSCTGQVVNILKLLPSFQRKRK